MRSILICRSFLVFLALSSFTANAFAETITARLAFKEINYLENHAVIVWPHVVFSKDPLGGTKTKYPLSRTSMGGEQPGNLDRVCQSLGFGKMIEADDTNERPAAILDNGTYRVSNQYAIGSFLVCEKKD